MLSFAGVRGDVPCFDSFSDNYSLAELNYISRALRLIVAHKPDFFSLCLVCLKEQGKRERKKSFFFPILSHIPNP